MLPTLADLAGISVTSGKKLDGVSLKQLLLKTHEDWPERMIFSYWRDRTSVRTQKYRLDHTGALFDMEIDPCQKQDVSTEHPGETQRLKKAVYGWREEMPESTGKISRPFPVGYREAPVTFLPARDGIAHGNIKRSNRCLLYTSPSPRDRS